MSYRVETVSSSRGMSDFLRLPFRVYRDDKNWVAPFNAQVRRVLNRRQNPYFRESKLRLFICYEGKEAVARACVVINPAYCEKFNTKTAFFGFFEASNDARATNTLFTGIEEYCRNAGITYLAGPFNPNHYSELGVQTDAFGSPPVFFENYNPEYYPELLQDAGFQVWHRLHTRRNPDAAGYVQKRYGVVNSSQSGEYKVRHLNLHNKKAELERIREVYNDAFSENQFFLPLTREEYIFSARFLRLVALPELVTIVEHKGNPVGVLQCVPDINQLLLPLRGKIGPGGLIKFLLNRKKIRDIVIYAVGIKKAYQHGRVFKLLLDSMCNIALKYGSLTTTWMSDDNLPSVMASECLALEPYKHFAIYKKRV